MCAPMRALVLSCAFAFSTLFIGNAQAEILTPAETASPSTQHHAASTRHHHRKAKRPASKAHTDSTASTGFQPPAASMSTPRDDSSSATPAPAKSKKSHSHKSKAKRAAPQAAKTNI